MVAPLPRYAAFPACRRAISASRPPSCATTHSSRPSSTGSASSSMRARSRCASPPSTSPNRLPKRTAVSRPAARAAASSSGSELRHWRAASAFGVKLRQCFGRDAQGIERRRKAAIRRDLEENLAQLLAGKAVVQGAPDMELQLVRAIERGDHAEIEQAAAAAVEARPVPDLVPAIFGDELLHRPGEVVGGGERLLDIGVADDGAPRLQSALELFAAGLFLRHD